MKKITGGTGEYKGKWTPQRHGLFSIKFDAPGMIPAATILRVGPLRSEISDTSPDILSLKQMADITGGTVFDIASITNFPSLLPSNSRNVTARFRHVLWDNWIFFCLFAAANLLELFLRKRWGLL